jgi:hypothetical protein
MPGKPGGAIQGTFPSLKLDRPVRYSSTLERDLLFVLEYDPQIQRYQEQPFSVQAVLEDGVCHTYTPDYAIWTSEERLLVECKPASQMTDAHTLQQIQIGTHWSRLHDWSFTVVSDVKLRQGARLANLKLLWRYSRLNISEITRHDFQRRCCAGITLSALTETPARLPTVLSLLFHHHLQADLDQPLTAQSQVWC